MEKIAADLHLFSAQRGAWMNYSWLLVRPAGNCLVACGDVTPALDEIEKLGGIKRVLLTDNHFAQKYHGELTERFGAKLVCHKSDKATAEKKCRTTNLELIDSRTQLDDDLLVIPTPGHAEGGLCYFWTPGKRSYLFTGDFLLHTANGWVVSCGQAKRKIMRQSLTTVGELKVQNLCPGCGQGEPISNQALKGSEYPKLIADTIEKYCG